MSDHESVVDLQERRAAGWVDELATTKNGTIIGDERNVIRALRTAPALQGLVRYDSFALIVEFTRVAPWRHTELGDRWSDDDDTHDQSYRHLFEGAGRHKWKVIRVMGYPLSAIGAKTIPSGGEGCRVCRDYDGGSLVLPIIVGLSGCQVKPFKLPTKGCHRIKQRPLRCD